MMFHSAAVKLTVWYLAIIMVLSISLSVALYNVSSHDLTTELRRQNTYFGFLEPQEQLELNGLRQVQINNSQEHLRNRLVLLNLVVLVLGGGMSYALARRTLRPIEETLDMQSRFTGDASHELRTPLTAMQTEIEVALRQPSLTKAQAVEQLESNLEEVGKLRALSDGLLTLASAQNDIDYSSTVSLKKVVKSAQSQVASAAGSKKIKLISDTSEVLVHANEHQLTNLIVILLDNAIKYSPEGGSITISVKRRDKRVQLVVSDQGIGIKQSDLEHIFERFYRADHSRSKINTAGYGLGLAIAKQIVERHKGFIEVKSQPDRGSTFVVSLPAITASR